MHMHMHHRNASESVYSKRDEPSLEVPSAWSLIGGGVIYAEVSIFNIAIHGREPRSGLACAHVIHANTPNREELTCTLSHYR